MGRYERFALTGLAARSLGVDLLYGADEDESPEEIGDEVRRLVAEISEIDPPSFDSPVMFWQHVVLFALKTFASEV